MDLLLRIEQFKITNCGARHWTAHTTKNWITSNVFGSVSKKFVSGVKILRKQCIGYIVDIRLLKKLVQYFVFIHQNMTISLQARRQRRAGRAMPPRFISCSPTVFFGEEEVTFFGRKNVEICDFRQKKPSDFGEELFFFWRSSAFGRKKTLKFRPESAFGNRRKSLPPPRSREAGDAPVSVIIVRECSTMTLNPKCQSHCRRDELSRKQLFSFWRLLMATRLV